MIKKGRGTVALVVAGVSLVVSLIVCGAGVVMTSSDFLERSQPEAETASASQVEAVAHVTLPPGTVLLSAACSNGLETRLSAKFRMPRAELDAFVKSAGFTAPLTPGLRAVTAEHNVGGGNLWNPESATTVSGVKEETEPGAGDTYRAVLFGLDDPGTVTVYLHALRS